MLEKYENHIERSLVNILGANGQAISSGFFIDRDGTVFTSYNTITKSIPVRVIDSEGNEYSTIMDKYYSSPQNDIAVLRIPKSSVSFLLFPDDNDFYNEVFTPKPEKNKEFKKDLNANNKSTSTKIGRFRGLLNGLPLIISNSINVIGLINSNGPAIYFEKFKTANFELLRIYLSNKYYFSKFDRRESGLKNLFNLQLNNAISNLINNGLYLPNNYCIRKNHLSIIRNLYVSLPIF